MESIDMNTARTLAELQQHIMDALTREVGKIIPGWQLAQGPTPGTRTSTAMVRKAIHGLRVSGEPICSCPSGYWYSQDDDEIAATAAQLTYRAMSILAAANAMKRHVVGQVSLDDTDGYNL